MHVDETPRSNLIPSLTGTRAIAAGMVFFYHWLFNMPDQWPLLPRSLVRGGYLGVAIFFALSGFLITARYYDDMRDRRISYRAYLWKRFARIYPLYFVILTLMVVIPGRPIGQPPSGAWSAFVQYSLTQALFPGMLLSGTATAWTLTIEGLFYLLAPPVMYWLAPGREIAGAGRAPMGVPGMLVRTAGLGAVSLGCAVLLSHLPAWIPNTLIGAQDTYLMQYSIFGRLPDLLIGVVLGFLYLQRDQLLVLQRRRVWLMWLGVGGLLLGMVAVNVVGGEVGSPINRALEFGVAASSGVLVLGMSLDRLCGHVFTRVLSSRVLVYLGKLSYALYLIQLTEPCQVVYWIVLAGVQERVLRALLLYLVATFMCVILFELVERPAQRLLTRRAALKPSRAYNPTSAPIPPPPGL